MKTRVLNLGFILSLLLAISACKKDEFYAKDYLDTPTSGIPDGTVDIGGTSGGVDSGVDGGTTGGSTTGSTTGGTDGSTVGGTDGSTVGGTTGGTYGDCNNGHGNDADHLDESNPTIGLEPKCKLEIFHQAAEQTKKLDIVWIIDDSGSMADEQSALGTNFSAFIDDFILKNIDFKMAITTTDTSTSAKKGKMVTGSNVELTSAKAHADEAKFKEDFNNMINVGTSGSGNEKGLGASEGFGEICQFVRASRCLSCRSDCFG